MDKIRKFDSGATRDTNQGKYEYARFLSPQVLHRYARYMDSHRLQKDGSLREPDNWKKGFPLQSFMDSLLRHVMDIWLIHETGNTRRPENGEAVDEEEALCGIIFNSIGYLHEILKKNQKL